jgi:hypothetical protein
MLILLVVSPPGVDITFDVEEENATITYSLNEVILLF